MKVRIMKKPTFKIVGIKQHEIKRVDTLNLWKEINQRLKEHEIKKGRAYGIVFNYKSKKSFSYFAGYKISDIDIIRELDLSAIGILSQEYAIAYVKGRPSNSLIEKSLDYIKEDYLIRKGYKVSSDQIIEVYPEGNKSSNEYEMELWLPVEPIDE